MILLVTLAGHLMPVVIFSTATFGESNIVERIPCQIINERSDPTSLAVLNQIVGMRTAKTPVSTQIVNIHNLVCMYPQLIRPKLVLINRYLMGGRLDEASYLADEVIDHILAIFNVCGRHAIRPLDESVPTMDYEPLYQVVKTLTIMERSAEANRLKWKSDLLIGTLNGDLTDTAKRLYQDAKSIQPDKPQSDQKQ